LQTETRAVSPLRLEKLFLEDIGPFSSAEIIFGEKACPDLANVHLFTGPNGCGKTTVLDALAEIFRPLKTFGLIRHRFRSRNTRASFLLSGEPGNYGLTPQNETIPIGRYGPARNLRNSSGQFFSHGGGVANHKLETSGGTLPQAFRLAAFAYSGLRSLEVPHLKAIEPLTADPLANALDFTAEKRGNLLLQWIANNRTQSALAHQDKDEARINIIKHLNVLESCGLILVEARGRQRWHHLNAVPIQAIYVGNSRGGRKSAFVERFVHAPG